MPTKHQTINQTFRRPHNIKIEAPTKAEVVDTVDMYQDHQDMKAHLALTVVIEPIETTNTGVSIQNRLQMIGRNLMKEELMICEGNGRQ